MPSASPEPYTVTMFGWASRLAANLHLAGEALPEVGIGGVVIRQHLERRLLSEAQVGGGVHDREATGVHHVVDPVVVDDPTDLKRSLGGT